VGGQLILFTGTALPPGASRTLRFVAALVSAPGTVAQARATAAGLASGGEAASAEVIVWVQVRRAWPMETRAAIGKVWVDANNDGVQRSGEAGLAGIDIWTEDGLVATTDSTGKFSFTNLRPGRHAFRLDPRSIPDGYRLATDGLELVDASGWTTPRVEFRLVPSGAARGAGRRRPAELTACADRGPAPQGALRGDGAAAARVRARCGRELQPGGRFSHRLPGRRGVHPLQLARPRRDPHPARAPGSGD